MGVCYYIYIIKLICKDDGSGCRCYIKITCIRILDVKI